MNQKQRRVLEIIGFIGVYTGCYLLVLGPLIGFILPGFDKPAFSGPSFRATGGLPQTGRGWLFIVTTVPSLFGYMYLRAQLAGSSLQQYWEPSGGEQQ